MIGNTLSHYKIIDKLGSGGQGEVYLAEDSRLDRKVALKILPQHLSERAELRERFEREARAVSSLNHPHICTLYDIGEQDGIHFLVMEHLEGETLEARLAKGALPLEQTLEYAIQIADALDKAHRQGVVHRDLKPGNIMLVKSGAKLLDFGLAKLQAADTPTNLSALPTEQANLTAEGTILGTLQYMAPEQLEGKEADSRTDIFAFGAVVYEMATGKKAFEGSSQASLIAAIMQTDPRPMAELQPMTPPVLDRVIKKCLAKEPDSRWQSASDLHDELKWITEGGLTTALLSADTAMPAPKLWRQAIPLVMVALVATTIASIAVWNLKSSTAIWPVAHLTMALPENEQLAGLRNMSPVAVSPNGSDIAYVALRDGTRQLFLRTLDSLDARPISGTEGGAGPFFSPDGQWVGFFTGTQLKKVSIAGGSPTVLAPATDGRGGSWGSDGQIIFARNIGLDGLERVSDSGGEPDVLTTPDSDKGEGIHRFPQHLPGDKAILFTVGTGGSWDDALIVVQRLDTGERKVLIEGGSDARYVSTGHLVYVRAGALMAAPFDPDRLEVTGPPIAIVEGVMPSTGITGAAFVGFSELGWLAYVPGTAQATERKLAWVDRKGEEKLLPATSQTYSGLSLSPDGQRVAVEIDEGNQQDIWVYDIAREVLTRLTFEGSNQSPVWTPDGNKVTFYSNRAGSNDLFWKSGDGSGATERLTTSEGIPLQSSWSPDGQFLAFDSRSSDTGYDILFMSLEGESQPQFFLQTESIERSPKISPDGRWLAYQSVSQGGSKSMSGPFRRRKKARSRFPWKVAVGPCGQETDESCSTVAATR